MNGQIQRCHLRFLLLMYMSTGCTEGKAHEYPCIKPLESIKGIREYMVLLFILHSILLRSTGNFIIGYTYEAYKKKKTTVFDVDNKDFWLGWLSSRCCTNIKASLSAQQHLFFTTAPLLRVKLAVLEMSESCILNSSSHWSCGHR